MPQTVDRDRQVSPSQSRRSRVLPVLLATLAVRLDPNAERVAIESALETGSKLIVANMLTLPPFPMTAILAPEYTTLPHEEDLEAVRETAARAAAQGIATELLRVASPRPIRALLELVTEREVGLLVLGPDLGLVGRLRFRAAARRVRREAACLVWIVPDG